MHQFVIYLKTPNTIKDTSFRQLWNDPSLYNDVYIWYLPSQLSVKVTWEIITWSSLWRRVAQATAYRLANSCAKSRTGFLLDVYLSLPWRLRRFFRHTHNTQTISAMTTTTPPTAIATITTRLSSTEKKVKCTCNQKQTERRYVHLLENKRF